tara:strand:+ start:8977 stop:9945 length:969 start_codon:yes stop_codon:yes gene_type:complete
MSLKSVFNPDDLSPEAQRAANLDSTYFNKCGINGDPLVERVARLRRLPGEKVDYGQNGTYIRQGRNRPGDPDSGYGRYMGAGEISICAGPSSSDIRRYVTGVKSQASLVTEPNLAKDAAYINISQLNDPDGNENISKGTTSQARGVSSFIAKADSVRLLSRQKLVIATRTDLNSSHGTDIASHSRIEFIAANKGELLQPVTKAEQNNKNIKKLVERINELQLIVRNFLIAQSEFNLEISKHQHDSVAIQAVGVAAGGGPAAVAGGKVSPSIDLIVSGIKCASNTGIAQADVIMNELKTTLDGLTTAEPFGYENSASKTVYTT